MEAPELRPCPFCGGKASHAVGETGDGKPWHYVECDNCGAAGPRVEYAWHNIDVLWANAEAWNTRAPDPDLDALTALDRAKREARVEGLQSALEVLDDEGWLGYSHRRILALIEAERGK